MFGSLFRIITKATVNFVISLRQSVRMEQIGSHWKDFHEIRYLCILRNCRENSNFNIIEQK
jgi:hypothetical protein